MAKERWVSRGIVKMLIDEMKDYKAAAEVVSGASDVFAACTSKIQNAIAAQETEKSAANALTLQQELSYAEDEIKEHREWEKAIRERLGHDDFQLSLVAPLYKALSETAAAREGLDALVVGTKSKYLSQK